MDQKVTNNAKKATNNEQKIMSNKQKVTNNEQRAKRLASQQLKDCFANQFNAFYMIKKQIYSDLIEKKPSVRNLFFLSESYLTFSLLLFHKIAMM